MGKSLGDKLIVATDTDEKIRQDKGASKILVNNLCDRISMLQAIKYIDEVLYFNTRKELEGLIKLYSPDILLLGDDWKGGDVVGVEFAKEVRFLPRLNYSTSLILLLRFVQYNVIVIGDKCTDKYVFGECKRISPEQPVPVLDKTKIEEKKQAWLVTLN